MKVLITSTPTELARQAVISALVVEDFGWEALNRDPSQAKTVVAGVAEVAQVDLVLALIGWRRGPMPGPIEGWNGLAPWAELEVRRAFALAKPVLVFMTTEEWPERESDPTARAQITDFRAEIERLAIAIHPETDPEVPKFRSRLQAELINYRDRSSAGLSASHRKAGPRLRLRSWPRPEYPPRPWPLLLPYSRPHLLGGRDHDLRYLIRQLDQQPPVLGLHAVSGVGKTSLLAGGLVPKLRAEGRAVAMDRHPAEPGLAARLIGDLLEGSDSALEIEDGDLEDFLTLIRMAGHQAGAPPILILDQLEDLLRGDRSDRARLGLLMAVTIQRRSRRHGAPCRWLLAYRREAHGELVRWLEDALREARALGMADSHRLPHNLASYDRFQAVPLRVVGRSEDDETSAQQVFESVLTTPLALRDETGEPRYPWRFAGDGAQRLAQAFAEVRHRDPEAPLVPELQVVLADLMANAPSPAPGQPTMLVVPEEPGDLIEGALERHLERALDTVFAPGDRIGRMQALLALYELARHEGRRGSGPTSRSVRQSDELIKVIGQQGHQVFEKLQAPDARLVIAERVGGERVYVLSHHRLAEVIVAAVEGQGRLAVAPELLDMRRFVVLRSELYQDGERTTSPRVSRAQMMTIEKYAASLLPDAPRQEWWRACRRTYHRNRRRQILLWSLTGILLFASAGFAWSIFTQQAARESILEQIAFGGPKVAFKALTDSLANPDIPPEMALARLSNRASPLDVLAAGMGGVAADLRPQAVLRAAERIVPWLNSTGEQNPHAPRNQELLANLIWALDYGPGRDPELSHRALELRNQALAPLRRRRPPPTVTDDPAWVSIPAGTDRLGSEVESDRPPEEKPGHTVTLDTFRMLDHEVTNADYRRLVPTHPGPDELPATSVTWYEATLYAAWLGGRLPTEAEWEYAALAGCDGLCLADRAKARTDDVAWTASNSRDPQTGEPILQPGRQLAANPFGLYDMFGNAWEWTTNWFEPYSRNPEPNPWGSSHGHERVYRGGGYWMLSDSLSPQGRVGLDPGKSYPGLGFRVVLSQ